MIVRLNALYAILAILCVVAANPCNAEPGKEIIELLEEPVSLFEWGLINVEKSLQNVVRLEPIQRNRIKDRDFEWRDPSVHYDDVNDRLFLNFRLATNRRENRQDLCRNAMIFIKEMLTAGWDPKDPSDVTFIGLSFLPYTLKGNKHHSKSDIRRSRYIDSIAHVRVMVEAENNCFDFSGCESPLTAKDKSIQEFPALK